MKAMHAVLTAVVVSALAIVPATAARAASDLSDVGTRALAETSACAASADRVLAVIVVDESASLQETDPEALRVGAIETALDSLEALASQVGDELEVEAALATFGTTYSELVGWGAVTGTHGEELRASVRDELPSRNNAQHTDYREALKGANESIQRRANETGGQSCSLVLWFTDGSLDVDDNGAFDASEEAAVDEICTPRGISDSLRSNNTVLLALALFTEGSARSPSAQDQDLLQAIAEGTSATTECGTVPIPPDWSGGAYLRAADATALRTVFSEAGALIEGGVVDADAACPGPACAGGVLQMPVDAGVSRARVLVSADLDANPLTIVAPVSGPTELLAGSTSVDGADIEVRTEPDLTVVEITVLDSRAHGPWALDVGEGTTASLYYFWDARVVVEEPPDGFVIGQTTEVPIVVLSRQGDALTANTFGDVTATVSAAGASADVVSDGAGGLVLNVTVPNDDVVPEVDVSVDVTAVTATHGIRLGPVSGRTSAETVLPASYPSTVQKSLRFPNVVGTEAVTSSLTIVGPERGEGRACVAGLAIDGPSGADGLTLSLTPQAPECVDVAAGQEVELPLSLATESGADGVAQGSVQLELYGVDADEPLTMSVPVEASMERPVDEVARVGWTILLVALAILFALMTAYLGRHLADRYRFGQSAQYCEVPVVITAAGVQRSDSPGSDLVDPVEDFSRVQSIGAASTTPRKTIGSVTFDRKLPLNPWRSAQSIVTAGPQMAFWGPGSATMDPAAHAGRATFPGTTDFVLTADPEGVTRDTANARLLIVVDAPDGVAAVLPERLDAIRGSNWSQVLTDMNAAADERRSETGGSTDSHRDAAVSSAPRSAGDSQVESFLDDAVGGSSSSSSAAPVSDFLGSGDALAPPPATEKRVIGSRRRKKEAPPEEPPRRDGTPPPMDFLD
ncbi:VWA domain-containing protein [Demequina sp. B12]|nr:VWA domain-containing protein [Demequina sp. B12]MDE0572882.1 VWA domain-containing protein [Demequina sp. B12]